ncbi:unnamed protein product, partial [Sphacelaria rigidula]
MFRRTWTRARILTRIWTWGVPFRAARVASAVWTPTSETRRPQVATCRPFRQQPSCSPLPPPRRCRPLTAATARSRPLFRYLLCSRRGAPRLRRHRCPLPAAPRHLSSNTTY